MRELSFPGRDPRGRLLKPDTLDPRTDPVRLVADRVVTGWVTSVASFGAFVDVGLPNDAMIHISEISSHYVRDARELLSIGQTIRARITESSGPRLTLSLKKVPPVEWKGERAGGRGGDRSGRSRASGRRGGGDARAPREESTPVRAASTRRDGLGGKGAGRRPGRGGPGSSGGRGGQRDRGGRDRDGANERVDLERLNSSTKAGYSPFASFFKDLEEDSEDQV
jgi:uncharacterized protein